MIRDELINFPLFVYDTGLTLGVGFGTVVDGALKVIPRIEKVSLNTDSAHSMQIKDISLRMFPYQMREKDDAKEVFQSYVQSMNALLAGSLQIETPHKVSVPTRYIYDSGACRITGKGNIPLSVHPPESTRIPIKFDARSSLRPSSAAKIQLSIPSFSVNDNIPYSRRDEPFVYVWKGILSVVGRYSSLESIPHVGNGWDFLN